MTRLIMMMKNNQDLFTNEEHIKSGVCMNFMKKQTIFLPFFLFNKIKQMIDKVPL